MLDGTTFLIVEMTQSVQQASSTVGVVEGQCVVYEVQRPFPTKSGSDMKM